MSTRHLDRLFQPRSVAVIGASSKPQRIGTRVLANLADGGYDGALWPLNPKYDSLHGLPCYVRVAALPAAPELAILCTPPATIAGLVAELGARGTRAAIVMTAGLGALKASGGRSIEQAMLDAARPHNLRILGPGSVGLLAPASSLNASFAHIGAAPGKLAFVSQSGALGAAVLDWASLRGIGFSRFVALGDAADIDFGDLLDYLAEDADTSAILLCIEQVSCARKFMSAARLAARGKPVIVLKVGRDADPDAELAFDSAVRRAGMLRVGAIEELFDAVETLARARPQRGERLALLTNGAGLGLIAADALRDGGAQLAPLSADTLRRLKRAGVPATGPGHAANPVNLLADEPVERYTGALAALLREPGADALLFVHAPTAMVPGHLIAEALAPLMLAAPRNVLSCWLGGRAAAAARAVFDEAGLPTYRTPEQAVRAFLQTVQYRRNQDLLMEVPASLPDAARKQRAAARKLVSDALAAGRTALAPDELRALLSAYEITLTPDVDDDVAPTATATVAATSLSIAAPARPAPGTSLALKLVSDAVFGPVLLFGHGDDRSAGLPPLNMVLARDLLQRTRIGASLDAVGLDAVGRALVRAADMAADLPELAELLIAPLLVKGADVLALGASARLAPVRQARPLAIRPYPQELEQQMQWHGGTIVLRPVRPEDAPQHLAFFRALDADDVRLRFFSAMRDLPPPQLARLTQIDYDRAMAFIATRSGADGQPETLGVVRAVADADNASADFAVIVRSDLKGLGLGQVLFQKLVAYFQGRGTGQLSGEALAENAGVQKLVRRFGGSVLPHPDPGMVRLQLVLN